MTGLPPQETDFAPPREFRVFLQETLLQRCRQNPRYSLRAFARSLAISPSALSAMLRGKRPITNQTRERIGLRLGLSPTELTHFQEHRHGNGASSAQADPEFRPVALDAFAVIAEWHHYAILELLKTKGFSWQPRWIGARLGISALEVNAAIERLVRVGLLKPATDGTYTDTTQGFSSDLRPGLSSAAHRRYQQEILAKAIEAIGDTAPELRDNTSITMAIDPAHLPEARARIAKFRRRLNKVLESRGPAREVYQLAISLSPLTREIS